MDSVRKKFIGLIVRVNVSFEVASDFEYDPPAGKTSKSLVEEANNDSLELIEFVYENYDVLKEQYSKKVI